jgi:TPR repeat protein
MYENGIGTAPNISQAAHWYRKAADQGNPQAANNLAVLYERGTGVARDIHEAMKLYALAAEKGDGNSYMNLLHLCANEAVPDYDQAYFWGLLAQRSQWAMTVRPTQKTLESLRSHLTQEQANSIEAQAEEWNSKHPSDAPIGKMGESWSSLPSTATGAQ